MHPSQSPVGFDLDLTLIDSRAGILASFAALAKETATAIDLDVVEERLGLKLEDELASWYEPSEIDLAAAIYRRHYLEIAPAMTTALPGAKQALAAVRASGAECVIVTAKHEMSVRPCLDATGLEADRCFSFVHGTEKGAVLASIGACCYVGDTPADVAAARVANAVAIAVATGSYSAGELLDAGADVALASLTEFHGAYSELLSTRWTPAR